jgi:hypothetical protein
MIEFNNVVLAIGKHKYNGYTYTVTTESVIRTDNFGNRVTLVACGKLVQHTLSCVYSIELSGLSRTLGLS